MLASLSLSYNIIQCIGLLVNLMPTKSRWSTEFSERLIKTRLSPKSTLKLYQLCYTDAQYNCIGHRYTCGNESMLRHKKQKKLILYVHTLFYNCLTDLA